MPKIYLADIQSQASEQNWKVLSTEYVNLDTNMEFACPEGHKVYTTWKKLRNKFECPLCKETQGYTSSEVISKSPGAYRIIALDQASHTTGYAIFDNGNLIKFGTFNTNFTEEIDRCKAIKDWLISLIMTWRPDFVGLEGIQFQEEGNGQKMGVTVFQTLARLQGILMLALLEQKIQFEVCPTNTWRHFCGVKGKTRTDKKRSMQLLVKNQYNMSVSDDEADAIGIGHYLVHRVQSNTTVSNWEV